MGSKTVTIECVVALLCYDGLFGTQRYVRDIQTYGELGMSPNRDTAIAELKRRLKGTDASADTKFASAQISIDEQLLR